MSTTVQRPPQPTTGPDLQFNLADEIRQLRNEPAYQSGRNAKTLVKHPDFRVVLTVIRANSRVAAHQAAGRVSVECVEGHITMHLPGKTIDLPTRVLAVLDRALPHDVEALKDSAFLVTIAWPENFDHRWNAARPCD